MLAFFKRITTGLWHARIVNWMSWACGITYIAVVLTVSTISFRAECKTKSNQSAADYIRVLSYLQELAVSHSHVKPRENGAEC